MGSSLGVPVDRWPAEDAGDHGRDGPEGFVRGRRGAEQARRVDAQVPDRARDRDELGRYGEDLAPHVLQRASCGAGGAPGALDRSAAEPRWLKIERCVERMIFTRCPLPRPVTVAGPSK